MLTSRQLEAFKAVIDAGSVVGAAEIIGLPGSKAHKSSLYALANSGRS